MFLMLLAKPSLLITITYRYPNGREKAVKVEILVGTNSPAILPGILVILWYAGAFARPDVSTRPVRIVSLGSGAAATAEIEGKMK